LVLERKINFRISFKEGSEIISKPEIPRR